MGEIQDSQAQQHGGKPQRGLLGWLIVAVVVAVALSSVIVVLNHQSAHTPAQPQPNDDVASTVQVSKEAQAVVNGDDSNIEQVTSDILAVGMPMYDDSNMMYVLAKSYAEQNNKPAAQYYLARINYTDNQIDQGKIQDLTNQIEALPDPVIEEGVNI